MIDSPSPGGIIAIAVVLWALQVTAVCARFWTRLRDNVGLGVDDYLVLAASIAYTAVFTIPAIIGAACAGLGDHIQISPTGRPILPSKTFNDVQFIFLTLSPFALGLARCSILFLYKRVFLGRIFTIVVWILIAWTVCWTLAFFFALLFKWSPVTTATLPPPGTRMNINVIVLTQAIGVTSAISDFFILLIPWPLVWELNMKPRQKLAVGCLFLLGNLTLAASIIRCVELWQIADVLDGSSPDLPYYDGVNIVWAMLETSMVIICSCLLSLGRYLYFGIPKRFRLGVLSMTTQIRNLFSRPRTSVSRTRSSNYERDAKWADQNLRKDLVGQQDLNSATALKDDDLADLVPVGKIGIHREYDVERDEL